MGKKYIFFSLKNIQTIERSSEFHRSSGNGGLFMVIFQWWLNISHGLSAIKVDGCMKLNQIIFYFSLEVSELCSTPNGLLSIEVFLRSSIYERRSEDPLSIDGFFKVICLKNTFLRSSTYRRASEDSEGPLFMEEFLKAHCQLGLKVICQRKTFWESFI